MNAELSALSHMPPHTFSGSELFKNTVQESSSLFLKCSLVKMNVDSYAYMHVYLEAENSLPDM